MAADSRLARARRLLRTQEQLKQAAEIERTALRQRAAALEADRAGLLAALSACAGGLPLLDAAANRLRTLSIETTALEAARARQDETVRERGLGAKRAETLVGRLALAEDRERERRDTLERLEGMAARPAHPGGDASLP